VIGDGDDDALSFSDDCSKGKVSSAAMLVGHS